MIIRSSKGGALPGAGPGRPKGMKNKFTSLKDSFVDVFKMLGGTDALYEWAKKSPRNQAVFYSWIVKMLPAGTVIENSPSLDALQSQLNAIADAMKP